MRCQEFREMSDSYISDELLVETNHACLRHLENCAACRTDLAARRELRMKVQSAVKNAPEAQINSAFAARLQSSLRETALHRANAWEKLKYAGIFNSKITVFAASSLLIVSLVAAIWLSLFPSNKTIVAGNNQANQADKISNPTESSVVEAVKAAQRELAHAAIGDHENCALDYRLKEEPITLTEAAEKFGRFNKDLDKAVIAAAVEQNSSSKHSDKIEFLEAHSCVFQGRRFAHVVLKHRNRVVSVLVTDTSLPFDERETIASQPDASGGKSVASFRAARHAVFVVSDLSGEENLTIARIISPSVRRHIERAEA